MQVGMRVGESLRVSANEKEAHHKNTVQACEAEGDGTGMLWMCDYRSSLGVGWVL